MAALADIPIRADRFGLGSVPVEDITARAGQIRFGRFALSLIGWVLYAAGYLTAVGFTTMWKAARWCAAAFLVGWESTHGPSKRQQIVTLQAKVRAQEMQLSRFSG